jgi:hypothetical protein
MKTWVFRNMDIVLWWNLVMASVVHVGNLKAVFTAEAQRTLRKFFFIFPVRGRKDKTLNQFGFGEQY